VLAVACVLLSFYFNQQQKNPSPTVVIDCVNWTQVSYWNFEDGFYPTGWYWGKWSIVNDTNEGIDPEGDVAVYFFPHSHRGTSFWRRRLSLFKE
jgi:hypothetical protein